MLQTIFKQKKLFIKYTTLFFISISLAYLLIATFMQYNINESMRRELFNGEENLLESEKVVISNRINRITGDLLYVADSMHLINDGDGDGDGDGDFSRVEESWKAFSDRKMIYEQIRFIDLNGDEKVRVNYTPNGSYAVGENDLQNKKERYYFTETVKLAENQIYVSELDLNKENNKIEEPIKPMLRFSTPYYVQGELKGIIILNYLANDMLSQVEQIASVSKGQIYILNSDGYWIYHSGDKSKEWAFMYDDMKEDSFANLFSNEWKSVQNQNSGSMTNNNGFFSYSRIVTNQLFTENDGEYPEVLGCGDWILMARIPNDAKSYALINANIIYTASMISQERYYIYILVFIISMIMAGLVALKTEEQERNEYFAKYDTMTGVYNRRAGFEKLRTLFKESEDKKTEISICFIDINGLKEVNDTLGHESGDELIRSIVNSISANIRENDFVARLGGDEFLIIFDGLDEGRAEEVWLRIRDEFENINTTEERKYLVSASHGIVSFKSNSNEIIDAVVSEADMKMYEEKREIKKNLKIVRSLN